MRTFMGVVTTLVSLLAGCDAPTPSHTLPTDHFTGRFVAETRGDGVTRMSAYFLEREGPFGLFQQGVYLDGGDTLIFRGATQSVSLPGNAPAFVAELVTGLTENTRFEFDLQRPTHISAPQTWGTLPAPMDLLLPEPGKEYSIERDDLIVAWTEPGTLDDMWIELAADCVQPDGDDHAYLDRDIVVGVPGDPGIYKVDLSNQFMREECERYESVVSLYRSRAGHVDPVYGPNEERCENDPNYSCEDYGWVSVRQVRSVSIVLRP